MLKSLTSVLGFWLVMGLLFVAPFLPWSHLNFGRVAAYGVESSFAIALQALALVGIAISLAGPVAIISDRTRNGTWSKLLMAGMGVIALLLIWAAVHFNAARFKSAAPGIGVYLAIVAATAAVLLGIAVDWVGDSNGRRVRATSRSNGEAHFQMSETHIAAAARLSAPLSPRAQTSASNGEQAAPAVVQDEPPDVSKMSYAQFTAYRSRFAAHADDLHDIRRLEQQIEVEQQAYHHEQTKGELDHLERLQRRLDEHQHVRILQSRLNRHELVRLLEQWLRRHNAAVDSGILPPAQYEQDILELRAILAGDAPLADASRRRSTSVGTPSLAMLHSLGRRGIGLIRRPASTRARGEKKPAVVVPLQTDAEAPVLKGSAS